MRLYFFRQRDQPIGLAAHCGYDNDDLMALALTARDAASHIFNALCTAYGRAAIFLDD